jgi:hypothetical protein
MEIGMSLLLHNAMFLIQRERDYGTGYARGYWLGFWASKVDPSTSQHLISMGSEDFRRLCLRSRRISKTDIEAIFEDAESFVLSSKEHVDKYLVLVFICKKTKSAKPRLARRQRKLQLVPLQRC